MSHIADNAIIMAAGLSSRFAPLSYERPKALITVKGEVLIERQIRQLREAGIKEIILVVGYRKEQFYYLADKFGVKIVENTEYETRNNNSSIYAARGYLKNSYICSADNYFSVNPFESEVEEAYYSAVYADGETKEWCLEYDSNDWITDVAIGGRDKWFMLGHVFWTEEFSRKFLSILKEIYHKPSTAGKLWESIYMEHMDELKLKIRRYGSDVIYEFDSLDELREFDESYIEDTCSEILKNCAKKLGCKEAELTHFIPLKNENGQVYGCSFDYKNISYQYNYETAILERI
uniref:NTP transferase domain-containing protein n=1 Tax=Agathobacter sp. TaxID=2021311 RepID=UPI0040564D16